LRLKKYSSSNRHFEAGENQEDSIMTNEELEFSVFCIECVADELAIDGKEAYRLMTTCPGLNVLDDYVIAYYSALHTQGQEYIVRELLEVMRKRGAII
jgi:hypothetical protein